MRITGGRARGIHLKTTDSGVRPATDRMREALFSSLSGRIVGANFADLFAGSGSYGLEALSRGAARGIFVEKHTKTCALLRENVAAVMKSLSAQANTCELPDPKSILVYRQDVLRLKYEPRWGQFDIVFCDPPYNVTQSVFQQIMPTLLPQLAPGGIVCFEMPAHLPAAIKGWNLLKRIGKGSGEQPIVNLLQCADAGQAQPEDQ